jgi:hypothetical protein
VVAGSRDNLVLQPEARWAQVTFLVPVHESAPPLSVSPDLSPWRSAPVEFPVTNELDVAATDKDWRSRIIAAGARAMLYDERTSSAVTPPAELAAMTRGGGQRVTLTADHLEFLPTGITPGFGPGGILVVHAALRGSAPGTEASPRSAEPLPVRWLAAAIKDLARPPAGQPAGAARFVRDWGLSLYPDAGIMVAVNLAWPDSTSRALRPDPRADPSWDALLCWAWGLARGTVPSAGVLRAPVAPATPGQIVRLTNRIAVVDRSGIAIVSTTGSDADVNVGRVLSEFVPVFQSIYTDVFLLGYLETLVTAEVGARLDGLTDPASQPREFHAIELRARILHNRLWRTRITEWPWVNAMLSAFQEENGLVALLAQLNDNIRDYGDQIERNYQHGLNLIILLLSMLGFVGVIAGVFGSVAAFMTVFGTGHWGAIVGIIGASAGLLALTAAAALLLHNSAWRELAQYLRR